MIDNFEDFEDSLRKKFLNGVSRHNINGRLSHLYNLRDETSRKISECVALGTPVVKLELHYNLLCDAIYELCDLRDCLGNCALKGDADYEDM